MNKDALLKLMDREFATTLKVLKAFPEGFEEFKPHERSRSALNLVLGFAVEENAMKHIVRGKMDMSIFQYPEIKTIAEGIHYAEATHADVMADLRSVPEEEYVQSLEVMGRTMVRMEMLWLFALDQIHHRGQFSVYLRMVGGKVPSIYGPSGDDPGI